MAEINITSDEQVALAAIDNGELDRAIERAIQEETSEYVHRLPLAKCGSYIETELRRFEQALVRYRQDKAPRKRSETGDALRRAGQNLSFAVGAIKRRMETEQQEAELFYVDDQIAPLFPFTKRLSVTVRYRWRRTVDDKWRFGSIAFVHDVDLRPGYKSPAPKRKPSPAKQEQDRQQMLYETWEHLMRSALYSVRDYFRDGGDGDKIPDTFRATVDAHSRRLNNYSTEFWRQQP